jgi:hypothetical protein
MELTLKKDMFNLKLFSYLFNPKLLLGVVILDFSGIMNFISKYLFADFTFLKFLVIACSLDLLTGITKVWVNNGMSAITSRGIRDTVSKAIQYGSFLIITHVLTHFEVGGQTNSEFLWLNKVAYEFLILIEIKSVYENIIKINPKLDFIDGVVKRILEIFKSKNSTNETK